MKNVKNKTIRILAIESSCDETSASIIEANLKIKNLKLKILSNVISSQVKLHARYGGVYPELASREHIRNIIPVIEQALQLKNKRTKEQKNRNSNVFLSSSVLQFFSSIDAIAVTTGPGLIGSLLVGVNTAKTLAYTLNKPIYAINHLEGHIYANFIGGNSNNKIQIFNQAQNSNVSKLNYLNLNKNLKLKIKNSMPQFPLVALVVSGGHTSLVYIKNHFNYQVIGETLDDAAGEVFDKVARMLDLGYPGGPVIAKMAMKAESNSKFKFEIFNQAQNSNFKTLNHLNFNKNLNLKIKNCIKFPRPMINENNFDFSFSGLKTAVLYAWQRLKTEREKLKTKSEILNLKSKICYEFQEAVVETLVTKTLRAAEKYQVKSILLCGGVSANSRLQEEFELALSCYPEQQRRISSNRDSSPNVQNGKPRFFVPEKSLTGDNAAMIGIAALYRIALGKKPTPWYDINANPNQKLF